MADLNIPGFPAGIPAGFVIQDLGGAATGTIQLSQAVSNADIIVIPSTTTLAGAVTLVVQPPQFPTAISGSTPTSVAPGWIKIFRNAAALAGFTITVIGPSGTGVVIAAHSTVLFSPDGVNVFLGSGPSAS